MRLNVLGVILGVSILLGGLAALLSVSASDVVPVRVSSPLGPGAVITPLTLEVTAVRSTGSSLARAPLVVELLATNAMNQHSGPSKTMVVRLTSLRLTLEVTYQTPLGTIVRKTVDANHFGGLELASGSTQTIQVASLPLPDDIVAGPLTVKVTGEFAYIAEGSVIVAGSQQVTRVINAGGFLRPYVQTVA